MSLQCMLIADAATCTDVAVDELRGFSATPLRVIMFCRRKNCLKLFGPKGNYLVVGLNWRHLNLKYVVAADQSR